MTNDEFLSLAKQETNKVLEILKNKNSDYTGGSFDPFANFRVTEALGLSNAETGILIRMVDKVQRIKSFVAKGSLQVSNESVQDSLRDIIGYSLILLGMLDSKKLRPAPLGKEELEELAEMDRKLSMAEVEREPYKELTVTQPFIPKEFTDSSNLVLIDHTRKSGAW